MNRSSLYFSLLLVLAIALPAPADDQQKAQKVLNQLTAMATDTVGRRAVSWAISENLSVGRPELAKERHAMNINYGELFLAHHLVRSGSKMDNIAAQMKGGKSLWQIAEEQHINWKQVIAEAKKVNSSVDNNLLRHFQERKADPERAQADGYDPVLDSISADNNVTQQEIEEAERRYIFLRDHSGAPGGGALDTSTEKAFRTARPDPVRNGGPADPDTNTRPGPRN